LFDKVGLKSVVFKSGKFKDIMNGAREPSEEELALVQTLVMETYEKFLQIVSKERNLDAQDLRNGFADGRILSGKQALDAKLINQTGSFQDAVKKAMSLAKVSEAKVSDYVAPFTFRNLLGILAESNQKPTIKLEMTPDQIPLQQGKLYYLSYHLF
jgi:protease-4